MDVIKKIIESLSQGRILPYINTLIIFLAGIIILKLLTLILRKTLFRKLSDHSKMLVTKFIFYAGVIILFFIGLQNLGVSPATLLGAAGITGIALGFASQTSMSNLISGLFLLSERPFSIGDLIKVGDTTGFVISVDLLSVKVRTFDNKYIRIPSEKLINQEMANITYYPIRRLDIDLSVAYKEDIRRVFEILKEIAEKNPYCLDQPEPLIVFKGFGTSGIDIFMGVWFIKTDYLKLKNSIMIEIKERFEEENIEFPFPHITLYTGSNTAAFPVEISEKKSSKS
ncbi:mechanosensitive ion channel family protein [Spirochaetia bacterium 38H-sp]|uniref:Mechanosensitive ion channel family protein n=1 Tax=Rarispira pelagica TaxID=3141764 RepID=A0ABU9UC57_9SPIR